MITRILDFLEAGGFVMVPLTLGALVMWYGLGWRMMTLGAWRVRSMLSEARDSARRAGVLAPTEEDRTAAIDETLYDYHRECEQYSSVVKTIVMIAPLAGLLGTVTGMIETFDALGDMSLFSQSGGIAGGISQALISTQMGLAVAIPGLVAGRLLDRRAEAVQDRLEQVRADVTTDRQEDQ
jgi:biopolymer transport protein ExbB